MSNQEYGVGVRGNASQRIKSVRYIGNNAIVRGQGLSYNAASITLANGGTVKPDGTTAAATDPLGTRNTDVTEVTTALNSNFAGWAVRDYSAFSGGQDIQVYEPGSTCDVLCYTATTVNVGRVTVAITGYAGASIGLGTGLGLPGRGSAIPLQTTATATVSSGAGPILGLTTGTYVTATKVLTATLTNAAVGDKVIVVGGRDSSYVANTPGVYTISALTGTTPNFTAATLSTDLSGSATDPAVSFYLVRGNPTVLCKTEEGGESGLIEFLTGVGNGAVPAVMAGGTTVFVASTNATATYKPAVVDGTILGQRKNFHIGGTQTTNGVAITPTSSNVKSQGISSPYSTFSAVTTITSSTTGNNAVLEWDGIKGWTVVYSTMVIA